MTGFIDEKKSSNSLTSAGSGWFGLVYDCLQVHKISQMMKVDGDKLLIH